MYVHLILRVQASDVEESTITKYAESKKSFKAQKNDLFSNHSCISEGSFVLVDVVLDAR
jgi:hypothetical protein